MKRRTFMQALACGTAAAFLTARRAFALGDHSKFTIAQLAVTGGNWDPRPTALRRLLWEVDKRTSVDTALESVQVKLEAEKLHQTPFLCLAGDRAFAMPSEKELSTLRRFLTFGGFLLIDSAEGRVGGDFDASVRRLVDELFPRPAKGLEALPTDHVVYKSFYLIEHAVGRLELQPQLEGLTHDGRAAIVYSQNDLLGAWARDNYGTWENECYPGGERQREMAFRVGVNLVMYALCLDYKTDQVHVPFIMKRRRWKLDDEL
jgi:hypothetical protein